MIKPEKFGHLHLVYHFIVPLRFLLLQRNQLQIGTSQQVTISIGRTVINWVFRKFCRS